MLKNGLYLAILNTITLIQVGDIAQLSFNEISFEHSLIIIKIDDISNSNKIYIASHTFDSLDKKISEYSFKKIRFIHIVDVGL